MIALEDDEHVFQAVLQAAGTQENLFDRAAGAHGGHGSSEQPFRKDAIVAGGIKPFSDLDGLFVLDVIHHRAAISGAFQRSVDPVFLRKDARGEGGIGDQQQIRRGGIGADDLADNSIRRDHRHAGLNAAAGAAIDQDHPAVRSGRVSDDARRHRFHAGLFLEHRQGLAALGRIELGAENLVLELDAVEIGLQALVLLAHVHQDEIILEEIDGAAAAAFEQPRQRRHRADRPDADQADFLVALDLVGQQHQLDENRRHQRREVAVAIENQIHNNYSGFYSTSFIQRLLFNSDAAQEREFRQHFARFPAPPMPADLRRSTPAGRFHGGSACPNS